MKNLYYQFLLYILTGILLTVSACGREGTNKYKIGVSQCSGDYWRVKTNEDLKRELLLHDDVELEIRSADSDNERQTADIRYFMDNDFDLIIVSPNETEALTPIVNEAYNRGIPVVTFDRSIKGDSFTAHMEVDNYALGKSVAQYAGSFINEPIRVIEIQGPTSASPAQRRHAGFTDAINGIEGSKVLASVYGNWDDVRAAKLTDSLLNIYPETNLIYAHTDHMAIGAARVVKERGRNDISILGIDGFPHVGIQAVKDSLMTATFLYPSEGERLLKIALSILKKEPYDRITEIPPLSPVDRSNADIILSQDTLLASETAKINFLRSQLDEYWTRHSMQTMLLYAIIIILVLVAGLLFVLLRTYNSNRKHQKILMQKNDMLEEEKEKQKELYDRLQEATQSKLMFFTNVSHDLRTPLTLISGPIDQVETVDYLLPHDRALMQMAKKNVNILKRLIDQILDFRKYENGKVDLRLSEVDFSKLLQEWTDAFKEVAHKRDIRLKTDISSDIAETIAVDVEKMERVFFNLMSNAFKHTPDNGKINVVYSHTVDEVSFSIKDTGVGISAEDCKRIFERFYQGDNANPKGSGIGLALTKAFVELHGGTIDVKSEEGKGSEFKVTMPIHHCDNSDSVPKSEITSEDIEIELTPLKKVEREFDTEKPLILVIDDNRDIQKLIGDLLGEGYNILYASDGQQGLKMAIKYVPDLIICDVMMPVMDGMECLKRIKEDISTSHIPVLMLTACSLDEQRAEGYDKGADGYLSKPFSGAVLESRCRNLLQNRKRIKEIYGNGLISKYTISKKVAIQPSMDKPNDVESDFYSQFIGIVVEKLSDAGLNIEEISGKMGLSQSQFTRKIKALTNYTPVEIIRSMRLKRARTMVNGSEKTFSEIAFGVGFTSLAYFSKCYKDEFGVSPSEDRGKK